jgi:hypothetical protein
MQSLREQATPRGRSFLDLSVKPREEIPHWGAKYHFVGKNGPKARLPGKPFVARDLRPALIA